jgi:Peptidase of plants and bacteria
MIHRDPNADSLALSFALVAALLTGLAASASAQSVERTRWVYDGGFLQRTRVWVEQTPQRRYAFVECTRNPEFVELYDGERGYFVRLFNDKMLIRGGNEGASARYPKFVKLYDGEWQTGSARQTGAGRTGGAGQGGVERSGGGSNPRAEWKYDGGALRAAEATAWVERNAGGVPLFFSERARTGEFIELFDASRDYTLRLFARKLQIRGGNGKVPRFEKFTTLYAGRWAGPKKPGTLRVVLDVRGAPEARAWAESARKLCLRWHGILFDYLNPTSPRPERTITIVFKKMKGVAYTSAATITISVNWITEHPDDFGMVIHELTHVVQNYPGANPPLPSWLIEGIADHTRYYEFEPEKPFGLNHKQTYRDGYGMAATFLEWIRRNHDPGLIVKLNARLQARTYSDVLFKEFAGERLERLWDEFKEEEHQERRRRKRE